MTNRERIIKGLNINDAVVLADLKWGLNLFTCLTNDCDEDLYYPRCQKRYKYKSCAECISKWLDSKVKEEQ